MKVLINTDNNIQGDEDLGEYLEGVVEGALSHLSAQVTRVEVHLQDENGPKEGADDIRCMMEARVKGMKPTAVTHRAENVHEAANGAARKLQSALESKLGKRRDQAQS